MITHDLIAVPKLKNKNYITSKPLKSLMLQLVFVFCFKILGSRRE
jgi:hypothetical protein